MDTSVRIIVFRLISGLKSKNEEDRARGLKELHRIVNCEMKEVSLQSYLFCLDLLCSELLAMFSSGDLFEKKSAILAMGCLTEVDFMNMHNHCRRFANQVVSQTTVPDIQLAALEAHLIGQFSLIFPHDFVEERIRHSCEILSGDSSDSLKQFATLMLRELILNTPTAFFHHFNSFMDSMRLAVRERSALTRELAILTLRSGFALAANREHHCQRATISSLTVGSSSSRYQPNHHSQHHNQQQHLHQQQHNSAATALLLSQAWSAASVPWYRNCLIDVLQVYGSQSTPAASTASSDALSSERFQALLATKKKLSREDWLHGSMLLLIELLTSVQPVYRSLLVKLNKMTGLPVFDLLSCQHAESGQIARSILSSTFSRWLSLISPDQRSGGPVNHIGDLFAPSPLLSVRGVNGVTRQYHLMELSGGGVGGAGTCGGGCADVSDATISRICHRVLSDNFEKIWTTVLTWLDVRTPQLLSTLLRVLPMLVAFRPSYFLEAELHRTVLDWLFQCLRKDRERPSALITIALIGYFMKNEFAVRGYLAQLLPLIQAYLPAHKGVPSKKRSVQLETSAMLSIALFVESLGSTMHESVKPLLDSLMATGLNQPLISTCKVLGDNLPLLRRDLHDRILGDIGALFTKGNVLETPVHKLSILGLSFTPNIANLLGGFSSPGSGSNAGTLVPSVGASARHLFDSFSRSLLTGRSATAETQAGIGREPMPGFRDVPLPGGLLASGEATPRAVVVAMALKTIGTFNFKGQPLHHLIHYISDNFISVTKCEVKEIRIEAVKTCAHLMRPWIQSIDSPAYWDTRPVVNKVTDLMGKLLTVGTSDPDPDVRRYVFESIDAKFDSHLTQADHLSSLFTALHDEVFDIRCLVMSRLGRLSNINPAHVQPKLRKVLLHLLATMSLSGCTQQKEQATLLLSCLIATAPRFMLPYAEPLLQILVPWTRQALPTSLRTSLAARRLLRFKESRHVGDACLLREYIDLPPDTSSSASNPAAVRSQNMQTALVATQWAAQAAANAATVVAIATLGNPRTAGPLRGAHTTAATVAANNRAVASGGKRTSTSPSDGQAITNAVSMAAGAAAVAAATAATMLSSTVTGSAEANDLLSVEALTARLDQSYGGDVVSGGSPRVDIYTLAERFASMHLSQEEQQPAEGLVLPGYPNDQLMMAGCMAGPVDGLLSSGGPQWREATSVVTATFTALTGLSAVAPGAVRAHMDEFMAILCCMLQDSACFPRRSVAVVTLSRLVSGTGYVVMPYRRFPQLLQILLDMLKREESKAIRQEVLRCLGVIGALDPFKFRLYSGLVDTSSDTGIVVSLHDTSDKREMDITQPELVSLSWETEDTFTVSALSALIRTLRDPGLRSQYADIVRAIAYLIQLLGVRLPVYLRQIMPEYFRCLSTTTDFRLQELIISQLANIILVIRLHTKEFVNEIIDLLHSHWWLSTNVQRACIGLLGPMASVLGADFRPCLSRIVPLLLRTLQHEACETNLIDLLTVLPKFGYTLEDYAHIIVPAIANLIDVTSEESLSVLLSTASSSDTPKPVIVTSSQASGDHTEEQVLEPTTGEASANLSTPPVAGSLQLRQACLFCLSRLVIESSVELGELASQVVHPVCRLLTCLEACQHRFRQLTQQPQLLVASAVQGQAGNASPQALRQAASRGAEASRLALVGLQPACERLLTDLIRHMRQRFRLLLPIVKKTVSGLTVKPEGFSSLLSQVEKGDFSSKTNSLLTNKRDPSLAISRDNPLRSADYKDSMDAVNVLEINSTNLERAWLSSRMTSREDWDQWLRNLTTALLRESPNPGIRACSQVTVITPAIGRSLFNTAFLSCWPRLNYMQQDSFINTLKNVLRAPDQSTEVSQTILNLKEFLDKQPVSIPFPIPSCVLAERALANRAYAKALYYYEQQFLEEVGVRRSPTSAILSSLLTIYNKLQLEEAATGVLLYATRSPQEKLANEEVWREKLHDWKCALSLYERKLEDERVASKKDDLMLGRMRCLRALGQWAPLNAMASDRWSHVTESVQTRMAPMACSAAWALGAWDQFEVYTNALPATASFSGAFYQAVFNIHSERYSEAYACVDQARRLLDAELTTLAGESYKRAYADLVRTQLLSEAEEAIQYRLTPERRPVIRQAWCDRLRGCQRVVEDWSQLIQLRSLVLKPQDDVKTWLRFSGLCRRSGRFVLARQIIEDLLGLDLASVPATAPIPNANPTVVFAYTKLLWATGAHEEAMSRLCVLKSSVLEPLLQPQDSSSSANQSNSGGSQVGASGDALSEGVEASRERHELRFLMSKCCLRLGLWRSELYARYPPLGGYPDGPLPSSVGFQPISSALSATAYLNNYQYIMQSSQGIATTTSAHRLGWEALQSNAQRHLLSRSNLLASRRPGISPTSANSIDAAPASATSNGVATAPPPLTQAWDEIQAFVIQCYLTATEYTPENRMAWQSWAMANYAVFSHLDTLKARLERAEADLSRVGPSGSSAQSVPYGGGGTVASQPLAELVRAKADLQRCMELHAAPSVRGFVNSISLSPTASLQDSLRLINLLFKFGHLSEIREVIREGLTKIRLDNWLLVVQQLLTRIDTPREHVASIIVDLLIAVGKRYPQSMVYPLVLAFKCGGSDRRRHNANRILYSMEQHSPRLVNEAFLLNEELIRLSISWVEMWSEALEDASRVYFGEKDVNKMFRLLHPLHQMVELGSETAHESAFLNEHGGELVKCRNCCEGYERTLTKIILQHVWEGYYTLYRRFSKQVNSTNMLELLVASPRLHEYSKDWVLAVPGSFQPHRPLVRIARIKNCLTFMTSKQHPRKLTIIGSNGLSYVFLLKGHEDTRQDERVMQFFGLVNTLLMSNPDTLRRNLTIQRMSVIPLSTNTGLIGWVPNSDTLHSLVREYRDGNKTILNKENREMLHLAPDFDRLNVIQKTEVFEAGLRSTPGRDLASILWMKSHSSEVWFERRTNFVRSMATMSMVGYILGLGDRHPSNIMLQRETGKVVHIDFGDCFEVAMMREKFPEKIPFRLTRMIIAAMEVTGIDGVYRHTCNMVLSLMRTNRESLLAVLEAFIHDPLLQWVLLESRKDFTNTTNAIGAVPNGGTHTHFEIDAREDDILMAAMGGGQAQTVVNGGAAVGLPNGVGPAQPPRTKTGDQQVAYNYYQHHQQHRQHQQQQQQPLPQTTAVPRRPTTDRTGGPVPPQFQHQQQHQLDLQYQQQQPQLLMAGATGKPGTGLRRGNSSNINNKFMFTNPNYPDSVSLRDPYRVNPWRHHLCNGPWFGSYEKARLLRKQTEAGHIYVERKGLQGFIFSAKLSIEEDAAAESESQPVLLGNARARVVMEKVRQKLNGTERPDLLTIGPGGVPTPLDVSAQVDFLIREATSNENLCQMYIGWCAFW